MKELKEKADKKDKKKQETKDKKEKDLENFLRCREACVCGTTPCCATNLKQCPSCRNVMKSVCCKVACRKEDGSKPNMIVSMERKPMSCKRKLSIYNEESTDDDEDDESEDDDFDNEDCALKQTWESLSPPIPEEEIIGKWYGVIYSTKNRKLLYIGKVVFNVFF